MTFTKQDALDYLRELSCQNEQIAWVRLNWHLRFGFTLAQEALNILNDAFMVKSAEAKSAIIQKNQPHYHHLNPNNKWRLK